MKKILSCLAILSMISAMVSCERKIINDDARTAETSVVSEAGSPSKTTAVPDAEKKAARTTADYSRHGQLMTTDDIGFVTGEWVEENVSDPRTLTVDENGSFELKYMDGSSVNGTVKLITEVYPDGSVSYYQFCYTDGELWEYFFVDITDTTQDRITAGQGEDMLCFIRKT